MVLESNRDLVLRRLVECLSRDRTKHQVAEVTSLGLVQMTRKKLGLGLLETFSEPCEVCAGRGVIVHHDPVVKHRSQATATATAAAAAADVARGSLTARRGAERQRRTHVITEDARNALAQIAASTMHHDEDAATIPEPAIEPAAEETPVAILDKPGKKAPRSSRKVSPRTPSNSSDRC